jgi:hypothetical protein
MKQRLSHLASQIFLRQWRCLCSEKAFSGNVLIVALPNFLLIIDVVVGGWVWVGNYWLHHHRHCYLPMVNFDQYYLYFPLHLREDTITFDWRVTSSCRSYRSSIMNNESTPFRLSSSLSASQMHQEFILRWIFLDSAPLSLCHRLCYRRRLYLSLGVPFPALPWRRSVLKVLLMLLKIIGNRLGTFGPFGSCETTSWDWKSWRTW